MGESPNEEDPDAKPDRALRSQRLIERSQSMTDVHVYINRPADKEDADLEDLKESLVKLEHVSEVRFDPSGNVVAVSFEVRRSRRRSSAPSKKPAMRSHGFPSGAPSAKDRTCGIFDVSPMK